MKPTLADITIPRQEGESARAYAARVEYVTMGAGRSTAKVGQKLGKTKDLMDRWSARYDWSTCARQYDDQVSYLTVQQAAEQYRAELEDHRQRYAKTGRDLHAVATGLLTQLTRAIRGETIIDKDGKKHTIPAVELTSNTLSVISRAFTTAADMEAHALRVAELLPKLTPDDDYE